MMVAFLLAIHLNRFVKEDHTAFKAPYPLGACFMLAHTLVTTSLNAMQWMIS